MKWSRKKNPQNPKPIMLLLPWSESCIRKRTRKELWNSVVNTEWGGACLEGKVPRKPWTDHTTNTWHVSTVHCRRRGQAWGRRRWAGDALMENPQKEEFLCGYPHTYSWGLMRNQEGKILCILTPESSQVTSLYEKATGNRFKSCKLFPAYFPGKRRVI